MVEQPVALVGLPRAGEQRVEDSAAAGDDSGAPPAKRPRPDAATEGEAGGEDADADGEDEAENDGEVEQLWTED